MVNDYGDGWAKVIRTRDGKEGCIRSAKMSALPRSKVGEGEGDAMTTSVPIETQTDQMEGVVEVQGVEGTGGVGGVGEPLAKRRRVVL